jgi:putative membrane protein
MNILYRVLITALAILIVAKFVPGIQVDGLYPAIISAVILGFLNALVRPILFVLTLPITILSLGLFALVINGLLFLFAASFIEGFSVDGFLPAIIGSFLVSLISALGNRFIK